MQHKRAQRRKYMKVNKENEESVENMIRMQSCQSENRHGMWPLQHWGKHYNAESPYKALR